MQKVNISIEFRLFEFIWTPNSIFKKQFWIFRPNLPKKDISGLKKKKWTSEADLGLLKIPR